MNQNITLAPVVLFVFNRYEHTKQTIEALQKNTLAQESHLYIFSDGAKNDSAKVSVEKIRDYIKIIDGFKAVTIIERERNMGLAASIIDGVTTTIQKYGTAIVLEDDLLTSKYFLEYMNKALLAYRKRKDIFSISGFSFSTEFMNFPKDYKENIYLNIRPMSWSWATWEDRWENVDWDMKEYKAFMSDSKKIRRFNRGGTDLTRMLKNQMNGRIDSWYIRWSFHAIMRDKLTIYPRVSYVNNIGHDDSGTHGSLDAYRVYGHKELNHLGIDKLDANIQLHSGIVKSFNNGFNTNYWKILRQKLKKIKND